MQNEYFAHAQKRSRFLVLTKTIAAPGDENGLHPDA